MNGVAASQSIKSLAEEAVEQLRYSLATRLADQILEAINRLDKPAVKELVVRPGNYAVLYIQRPALRGRTIFAVLWEYRERYPADFPTLCKGRKQEEVTDTVPSIYTKLQVGRLSTEITVIRIASNGMLSEASLLLLLERCQKITTIYLSESLKRGLSKPAQRVIKEKNIRIEV